MGDINAGTLYIGSAYNGAPIERGLAKTRSSLLGFSRFQTEIMKGFLGRDIMVQAGRFAYQLVMSSEEMQTLKKNIWETGTEIVNSLIKPITEFAGLINDVIDNSKNLSKQYKLPSTKRDDFITQFENKYDPKRQEKLKKEGIIGGISDIGEEAQRKFLQLQKEYDDLLVKKKEFLHRYDTTLLYVIERDIKNNPYMALYDQLIEEIKNKRQEITNLFKTTTEETSKAEEKAKATLYPTGGGIFKKLAAPLSKMWETVKDSFTPELQWKSLNKQERVGEFMSGQDVWRRAVSGSLQGQVDQNIATNTKRTADNTEVIKNKPTQGGLN
jgi:hypothetical protein